MKWILIVLGGFVLLLSAAALAGALLPRDHRATSEITLAQPPDRVWAVVRDLGALQGTWTDLKSARRLADRGPEEVWELDLGGFPMRMVVAEAVPPRKLVTRIDADAGAAFGGTWTYELEEAPTGTRVRVTESGWVRNPLFRVLAYAGGLHRSLDGYLRALGTRFGERVSPLHQP